MRALVTTVMVGGHGPRSSGRLRVVPLPKQTGINHTLFVAFKEELRIGPGLVFDVDLVESKKRGTGDITHYRAVGAIAQLPRETAMRVLELVGGGLFKSELAPTTAERILQLVDRGDDHQLMTKAKNLAKLLGGA